MSHCELPVVELSFSLQPQWPKLLHDPSAHLVLGLMDKLLHDLLLS